MAKGVRSKKRLRKVAAKRAALNKILTPQYFRSLGTKHYVPKNAFVHPNDSDAVFPQY